MTPTTLALARRVRARVETSRWHEACLAHLLSLLGEETACDDYADCDEVREAIEAAVGVPAHGWLHVYRNRADVLALLDRVIAEGERCHERAAAD